MYVVMMSVECSSSGIRVLVDAREKLRIPWGKESNQTHGEALMSFDTRSAQGMVEAKVFQRYLPAVRALWADSGIQHAYDRRREFQLVRDTHMHTGMKLIDTGGHVFCITQSFLFCHVTLSVII